MNILFWTILLAIAIAAATQWSMQRRRNGEDGRRIEADSQALSSHPDWTLPAEKWRLLDMELLATENRLRAVITLSIIDEDRGRRKKCMEIVGAQLYSKLQVQAVLVVAERPAGNQDLFLFAPDGRGWWGQESVSPTLFALGESTSR